MLRYKRIVDLSQPIETNGPVYPTLAKPYIGYFKTHEGSRRPNGVSSQNCIVVLPDHISTHVDAPLHFDPAGVSVERAPPRLMVGSAVILDFSSKRPNESIDLDEVRETCRKKHLEPSNGDIVLFMTGASRLWGKAEYLDHVVEIKRDAIKWLISRGVRVIGVDAVSIDTDLRNHPSHMLMREEEFYIIENLANLDQVGRLRFDFLGLPLKLVGATASPIRAVALV